jgi:hypothetical protein
MALPKLNTISGLPGKMANLLNTKIETTKESAEKIAKNIVQDEAKKRESKVKTPDNINFM